MKNLIHEYGWKSGEERVNLDMSISDDSLNRFFLIVDRSDEKLSAMRENISTITRLHTQILASHTLELDCQEILNKTMEEFKINANDVKKILDQIQEKLKQKDKIVESRPNEFQIQKNQHYSISKELSNLMTEYSQIQTNYRDQLAKRIELQAAIAGKEMTYEEIDQMITNGTMNILIDQVAATEKAQETIKAIENRHNNILMLEKNLNDLNQLFVDLSLLVDQQGGMIDRIDHNVDQALDYVEKGEVEIGKAIEYKKKNIKLMIGIGILVAIIILAIIITIAVLVPKK